MKIVANEGAATSLSSEYLNYRGAISVDQEIQSPMQSCTFISPAGETEWIVVSPGKKFVIVIAASSTTQAGVPPLGTSLDTGTKSVGGHDGGRNLYETMITLFATARQEDFEDGVHTEFSRELVHVVEMLGTTAIEVVASIILKDKANPAVLAEALKWISHVDQPRSYAFRLWLLEKSLQSASPRIRDAASLGIAAADDPHSIPAVKSAIERETCQELRDDLAQVLRQLDPQCHMYSEK
ncbi:MAG: HEAT repeat domain-containing protein [Nitrospiraceae bacterium]|nr:HEAT repeat domain-containing protein [Nitrospiraceae bacterium]